MRDPSSHTTRISLLPFRNLADGVDTIAYFLFGSGVELTDPGAAPTWPQGAWFVLFDDGVGLHDDWTGLSQGCFTPDVDGFGPVGD